MATLVERAYRQAPTTPGCVLQVLGPNGSALSMHDAVTCFRDTGKAWRYAELIAQRYGWAELWVAVLEENGHTARRFRVERFSR